VSIGRQKQRIPEAAANDLQYCRWKETELRTYTFGEHDDDGAMLYETKESLVGRGKRPDDGDDSFLVVNDPRRRGQMPQ
jgi:hypothetical protein